MKKEWNTPEIATLGIDKTFEGGRYGGQDGSFYDENQELVITYGS